MALSVPCFYYISPLPIEEGNIVGEVGARPGLLTADVCSIVMMYIQALRGWWMISSQNWGNRRKENGEYSGGGDRI